MAIAPNNLTPEEIAAKNEDAYEYLLSLIEDTQGQMALILVACDSMAQRERIIKRYEADAWEEEKVRPFRIRLGQEPSLRAGLVALEEEHPYLKEEGRAVVSVTGAELLLRVKITGDEAQTELEKFFGYLQWTREALRAFKYPVVLWVSREILRELSRRAPDFWSWRKGVLRFEDEVSDSASVPQRNGNGAFHRGEQTVQAEDDGDLPPLEVLLEEIAALEDREPESYGLATLHHKLGQVYAQRVRRGEATAAAEGQKAIAAFQQGIERYQAQGNGDATSRSLNRLALFYSDQSQWAKALQTSQIALITTQQADNPLEEMIALRRIGHAQSSLCNFQKSIEYYQQSLKVAQAIKNRKGEAAALVSLGGVYGSLGDFLKAIKFHSKSLQIQEEISNKEGIAYCLNYLGMDYFQLGEVSKALSFHSQSLDVAKSFGYQQVIAGSLGNLGNVYYSLSDFKKAISFYSQSLDIQDNIGDKQGIASCLCGLGIAYNSLDNFQKAIDYLSQSLKITQEIGDRKGEANCHLNIGLSHHNLGNFQEAIASLSQSLDITQEIGDRKGEAYSLHQLARTQLQLNDFLAAQENCEQARVLFAKLHIDYMVENCKCTMTLIPTKSPPTYK